MLIDLLGLIIMALGFGVSVWQLAKVDSRAKARDARKFASQSNNETHGASREVANATAPTPLVQLISDSHLERHSSIDLTFEKITDSLMRPHVVSNVVSWQNFARTNKLDLAPLLPLNVSQEENYLSSRKAEPKAQTNDLSILETKGHA